MKRHSFVAILSLLFIGISCQMEEIDPTIQNELEITAHSEIVATKTQMAEETVLDEPVSMLWTPKDEIGVYGDACYNLRFVSELKTPARDGKFKGIAFGYPEYAYYPYNADAGNDYQQISVIIPESQSYSGLESLAEGDIKYGRRYAVDGNNLDFQFASATAMLRFSVDLSGLDGIEADENAYMLWMTASDGSASRNIVGKFKLNAETGVLTGDDAASQLNLSFGELKKVGDGSFMSFALVAPEIKAGDSVEITVRTDRHSVTYATLAKCDFLKGNCYDMPLKFSELPSDKVTVTANASTPGASAIKNIYFLPSLNSPAILDNAVYYDSSSKTTKVKASSGVKVSADAEGNLVKVIPYLYDFKLIPTLEMEDASAKYFVTVNGREVQSGKTTVDFTHDVLFAVKNLSTNEVCEQLVSIRNTGLPVVVANLNYTGAGGSTFAGITLPPKDSEFAEDHEIAIYNPDGTVSLEKMNCGMRLRGNFSASFPKKAIALKLASKKKVLGMPKHKRWCLLANWFDKTLIRNAFTYGLAENVAAVPSENGPGIGWQPHGKFVELVLNGKYVGNYYLCEQIKMDENRVNMPGFPEYETRQSDYAKSPETAEAPSYANCGYLLEFDNQDDAPDDHCYVTPPYQIKIWSKNDYDEIGLQTVWSPLKQDLGTLVANLSKLTSSSSKTQAELSAIEYVRSHIDYDSAADFMLICELAMNHDYCHPKSVYLRKAGAAGKLVYGPVWDFDVYTYPHMIRYKSYKTITEVTSWVTFRKSIDKWQWETLNYGDNTDKFWWYAKLLREQGFVDAMKDRWSKIKSVLPPASKIDEIAGELVVSAEFDGAMWPQTNSDIGMKNGDEWMTYEDAIESMKIYYNARVAAMDGMVDRLTVKSCTRDW
ncbi:MAG: CotH kinase family protein [Bacteroidales bacterium]|nr:CotH kinase family protein [Bacteroidales bacterium]